MTEDTERRPWLFCGDTTPRDRRNQLRVLAAMMAWAFSSVAVTVLIKREILTPGPVAWFLAAVPMLFGILVLLIYGRFLREADELQRVIQLRALALGFGGTFFAMATWELFTKLGAPAADLGSLGMVMAVFYALGSLLAWRRYR